MLSLNPILSLSVVIIPILVVDLFSHDQVTFSGNVMFAYVIGHRTLKQPSLLCTFWVAAEELVQFKEAL